MLRQKVVLANRLWSPHDSGYRDLPGIVFHWPVDGVSCQPPQGLRVVYATTRSATSDAIRSFQRGIADWSSDPPFLLFGAARYLSRIASAYSSMLPPLGNTVCEATIPLPVTPIMSQFASLTSAVKGVEWLYRQVQERGGEMPGRARVAQWI